MDLDNTVLALTRYEFDDETKSALLCGMEHKSKANKIYPDYSPTVWGQDAWIWNMEKIVVKNADFNLGTDSCDARIAHFILESGYKIYNPSFLISINHYDRLGRTSDNGDIYKGSISKKRDPPKVDSLLYKSFLQNKDDCVDKYTYSKLHTDKRYDIKINNSVYPHYLHDIEIKKNLINIPCMVCDNFGNIVPFHGHSIGKSTDIVKYLSIDFDNIYGIYIIDLKDKLCTKDDKSIGYVSKFTLSYENEKNTWVTLKEVFRGITRANGNFIKRNYFDKPIFCKKLRVNILEYVGIPEPKIRLFGNKITETNVAEYKMVYYDNSWQYPVITEYNIYKQLRSSTCLPFNYFAFPWANLIDYKNKSNMDMIINNYYAVNNCSYFTVIQHIHYKRLFKLFEKLKIKYVFASHYTSNDEILALDYNIKLFPFQLYAYVKKVDDSKVERNYLTSFIGNYESYYLSDIRFKIFEIFQNYKDCYIKKREKWHYNYIVYGNDTKVDEIKTLEYKNILSQSLFSLCPSGSGPNTIRLWESLSFGSIPVILADTYILPQIEGIDWSKCVIIWKENEIDKLYDYLLSIKKDKIQEMSSYCIDIYNKFFDDDKQTNFIFETLKNIDFNKNICSKSSKHYTLIILNWKRPDNVISIVNNMCNFEYINEILISNGNEEDAVKIIKEKVKIFNHSNINIIYGLDRRFLCTLYSKNDNVIIIDDDVFIENSEMLKVIQEYEKNKCRIVGIFGRGMVNDLYQYGEVYGEVDIVITRLIVFQKKLARLFFSIKPLIEHLYKEGNPYGNGEDIFFSFISSIYYKNKHYSLKDIKITELPQGDCAVHNGKGHLEYRQKLTKYLYTNRSFFEHIINSIVDL
jgi:hypothetical protein